MLLQEIPVNINNAISIVIGIIISFVVHWLKGFSFIDNNPKKIASLLSAIAAIVTFFAGSHVGESAWQMPIIFLMQLGAAIGTFETLIKSKE